MTLWAIVGATGTGKTVFSLDLAEALAALGRPAEVVGADAMQLYRGMDIGTAKLPVSERRDIPHHLVDVLDVDQEAAVAWYQGAARRAIEDVEGRGADAILVGGSGLYVSAVLWDFRFPPRDAELRARLEAELAVDGPAGLLERVRALDEATAERLDPNNGRRIVRALEVLELGERTYGAALPAEPTLWRAGTRIVETTVPRADLVGDLDRRVEVMWRDGLVDETAALRERGLERGVTASRAIGYAQALAELDGRMTEADAIAETQALTRRYARRQVSWFRRYDAVRVPRGADPAELLEAP